MGGLAPSNLRAVAVRSSRAWRAESGLEVTGVIRSGTGSRVVVALPLGELEAVAELTADEARAAARELFNFAELIDTPPDD